MIGIYIGILYGFFQSIYNNKKLNDDFERLKFKLELEYKIRNNKID